MSSSKENIMAEKDGYILDAGEFSNAGQLSNTGDIKTADDGKTVLIPQPSTDPDDPLNWSQIKKHLHLCVIGFIAFLPDYASSTGAVTNLVQPKTWNLPETTINHALVGNLFMLGAGGISAVTLSAYFGRLPVLFWFSVMSFITAAWSAQPGSFESFEAARILHGFFSTVTQAGGLMWIKDMFFFHEHPRKINIWSCFIVLSPYLGPFVASWIVWKSSWPWCYWIITILWGVALILIVSVMDEPFYDRSLPKDQQPIRKSRLMRVIGAEQWRSRHLRNSFAEACMRPMYAIVKLPVFLITLYYVFTFAWVIGLNATTGVFLSQVYGFGPEDLALYYFAPMVATILGELVGHWAFDFAASYYAKRHQGSFQPEIRLSPTWYATPLMVTGIVLLGFSLQRHWHYMVTAVVWGLYVFGIMICTTAINSYLLDAYPEASGEVAAWINFGRTIGGFIITYEEVDWAFAMGTEKALAIQAAIVTAAFGLIVLLQFKGKQMRLRQGTVTFARREK